MGIVANGIKLPPYIIFKGQQNSPKILKELNKLNVIKNKEIIIGFNENAWTTKIIMEDWLKKVLFPYLKSYDFQFKKC